MSFGKRQKVIGKPLDKRPEKVYSKVASETNEKRSNVRFRNKGTLTTEEWKAELELERIGASGANVYSSCQLSFFLPKERRNLRTSQA